MKAIGQMSGEEIKAYCHKMQGGRGYCHQDCPLYDTHNIVHCELMRHRPSDWDTTTPREPLTTSEMEICRAVGAKWVTRDAVFNKDVVELWNVEPVESSTVLEMYKGANDDPYCGYIGVLDRSLFPSIQPGDKICVDMGVRE